MKLLPTVSWTAVCIILAFVATNFLKASEMLEMKIDIGQNIVETAKRSGIPKFDVRDVDGLVSYSITSLPPDILARYIRPGFEGNFAPLFALTMYADETSNNNLAVDHIVLQFASKNLIDHKTAKHFSEAIISQFKTKNWKRHISKYCPAVTGRSSFLELDGSVSKIGACALDPDYRLSNDEWITLMESNQSYEWIGDGVLAKLRVGFTNDVRGITYSLFLDYSDASILERRQNSALSTKLANGDAKGWNSTSAYHADQKELFEKLSLLERNAAKRGDAIILR